ncbi:MAG: D-alanyl-D-alanine carboxypeptidase family protein [Andreesenia angusta]|nr:D-alanyl-D-alanine carboxypeptidase family protein [Andreesenia angusta]
MNRKLLFIPVFISLFIFLFNDSAFSIPEVFGETAVLIDADTGQVLYDKDKDRTMYPASTTKILTCIVALENSDLNDIVTVDDKTPFEVEGGHIALEAGEILTMDQLLNAMMLNSANDAAMVIGRYIGYTLENFSDMMNKKAKELGANNTYFRNPSGLPDKEHITTAYDLAKITQYALNNEKFRYYVSKYEDTIPPTNKKDEMRYLVNSNKMLYSDKIIEVDGIETPIKYEGITGVKTGYTDDAQNCLVSSAKRGDREYISVVLHSNLNMIYIDSHKLLDYAFNKFDKEILQKKDSIFKMKYKGKNLPLKLNMDIIANLDNTKIVDPSEKNILTKYGINKKLNIDDEKMKNYKKGDFVGVLEYYQGDNLIGSSPVSIQKSKGLFSSFKNSFFNKDSLDKKTRNQENDFRLKDILHLNIILIVFIISIFIVIIFLFIRNLIRKINRKKYRKKK